MFPLFKKRIKVIVTEDMSFYRDFLISGLKEYKNINIIGQANNGKELLRMLEYLKPDVITLNLQMPVLDGFATLPIVAKKYPKIKIVILSFLSEHEIVNRVFNAGAHAFLSKGESGIEEINDAIVHCFKKGFYFNKIFTNSIDVEVEKEKFRRVEKFIPFTDKQKEILKLLKQDKTIEEIANKVNLSPRTVAAIIEKLQRQTDTFSKRSLIEFARRENLLK